MKVYHWWPGREFRGPCPIPVFMVKAAEKMGSLYLTYVALDVGDMRFFGNAFCCPKDFPSRKMGRRIAVGRLKAMAEEHGIELDNALA